ncbi:MAG: M1 family aminopeptidase, partial [Glaciecola sp.]
MQVKKRLDYQAPTFTIDNLNLAFDLAPDATHVTSQLTISRIDPNASDELVLDGHDLALISILLDGVTLDESQYDLSDNNLIVRRLPACCTLTIVTKIEPQSNTALEGLYFASDTFCTQCEAEGFRRITYYLDRPDVLSVFTVTITADKNAYPFLLSNGNAIDSGELPNDRHFVTWHDPFKKPAYLFALVAGDFDVLEDVYVTRSQREVSLQVFVEKGRLAQANHAMDSLKKSMKWDEQTFNLEYDLDIYMIVAVDFFNMGAMENKGLNVFNSKFVLAQPESATDEDFFN